MENTENIGGASPGDILKRCREFHGMTLNDAAETTKISADHLQALEENSCDQFTSLAYLKGFARIYATSLGLNPDNIIRLYTKIYTEDNSIDGSATTSYISTKKKKSSRLLIQKLLIPVVLLVLILITSTFINRNQLSHTSPPQIIIKPVIVAPIVQKQLSSSTILETSQNTKEQTEEVMVEKQELTIKEPATTAPQEINKGFVVSLKIIRNTILTVTVDSMESQQHEMTTGDRIEWKGSSHIILELGDAGAVEAQLNGKLLPPLGGDGASKVITISENGVK